MSASRGNAQGQQTTFVPLNIEAPHRILHGLPKQY